MKRRLGFLIAIVVGVIGLIQWRQSNVLNPNNELPLSSTPSVKAEKRLTGSQTTDPVPCGNLTYARHRLDMANGQPINFFFLLETPTAADTLLNTWPSLSVVHRTAHVLTCAVPYNVAQGWLDKGLVIPGITAFDAEMPVELYGSVATGERFVGTAPLQARSRLDGRGEVVAVIDTGISTGDAKEFHPKLLPALYGMTVEPNLPSATTLTPADPVANSHGTHVAGCVVAQVEQSTDVRGSAPGAALYFQRFATDDGVLYVMNDLAQHFARSYAVGARIINCSWGHPTTPSLNVYNCYSRNVDQFVWEHPEVLICFAVGNDGCDKDGNNVVDLSSIYSSEAYAKNALIVGAQESYRPSVLNKNSDFSSSAFTGSTLAADRIAYPGDEINNGMLAISSRGPLTDGRIAPMLVAPGSAIWSTMKDGSVAGLSGTSMASPIVSGAAAVFRQYLREVHNHPNPTSALMRAGLILASESLTPGQFGTGEMREIPEESPNNVEGWGALRLGKMLQGGETNGEVQGYYDRIRFTKSGEKVSFKVENVVDFTTFTVALSWIDAPASVNTQANVLVNNYDLKVISPSGISYAVPEAMDVNPIERLIIDVGEDGGTWTIEVHSKQIKTDGDGNLAAVAWRAITFDDCAELPQEVSSQNKVALSVTLPEGHRAYLDHPVWPAPGTHLIPEGTEITFRGGPILSRERVAEQIPLSGWALKKATGERERGESETFTWLVDEAISIRWYQTFPGTEFRLR